MILAIDSVRFGKLILDEKGIKKQFGEDALFVLEEVAKANRKKFKSPHMNIQIKLFAKGSDMLVIRGEDKKGKYLGGGIPSVVSYNVPKEFKWCKPRNWSEWDNLKKYMEQLTQEGEKIIKKAIAIRDRTLRWHKWES